jgi:outer membrane lipoprotein-sorting protein
MSDLLMALIVLAQLAPSHATESPAPSAVALLEFADETLHGLDQGVIHIRATVEREGEATVSVLDVYVRSTDDALCVFREGPLAGRMILSVGDRVWLFVPNTTHPIRISASQRLLGGASVADVARLRFADEFAPELLEERKEIDGVPCRALALEARTPRAPYGSGTLWLGVADALPRRAILTLPSGKPAKELRFTAYEKERGVMVLRRMEIEHLLAAEAGTRTTLELLSYEPRQLDEQLFDPKRVREAVAAEGR